MTREEILDLPLPITRETRTLGQEIEATAGLAPAPDFTGQRALAAALVHLRRPFDAGAVKWKVQTENPKRPPSAGGPGGMVIAYFDARLTIERLNAVVGGEWRDSYRALGNGVEECTLEVFGVPRADVGMGAGPVAAKAVRSDALKRGGVKFGVGISVYAMKRVELKASSDPAERELWLTTRWSSKEKKEVPTCVLWPGLVAWLGALYSRWVDEIAAATFGPVLPHGDEPDAAGMEAEEEQALEREAAAAQDAAEEPQVEGERADALRVRILADYAAIRAMNPRQIPPTLNTQALKEAGTSLEGLEKLAAKRASVRAEMEEARATATAKKGART